MERDWQQIIVRNWAISLLVGIKLFLHLMAIKKYGFHRDEFLYLVQGDHLMWGYLEVPPFIAAVGRLATSIFGTDIVGIRLFPLLASILILVLIWRMVKLLGGGNYATLIAGVAFVFNPAFLRSGLLFQPVVFNQLWWVLCSFFLIRIIKYEKRSDWIKLGFIAGISFLTKYSIVFFLTALILGALLNRKYKWFIRPELYIALGVATLIALPNLWWQYDHNFPIIHHMKELRETQLVNVSTSSFIVSQLIMSFGGSIVWIAGLVYLFRREVRSFRMFGYGFFILMFFLIIGSGKAYYSLGVYPMLFAFGGMAWSEWLLRKVPQWNFILAGFVFFLNIWILPYGLPILHVEHMKSYGKWMAEKFGLSMPLVWEDGIQRILPQDYADMFGWEEMAQKVSRVYNELDPEVRRKTILYGGGYSHTATLNFYRKKYLYPEVYSLNNSFVLWVPSDLNFENQIEIDDRLHDTSQYFNSVVLMDSIENSNARERGYIYLKTDPKMDLQSVWKDLVNSERAVFQSRD